MRVLVTGASSGIGAAFARHYATDNDLVLVGRDRDALESVAREVRALGGRAEICVADLSDSSGVDALIRSSGAVDVLIANAGVTHAAAIGTTDLDQLDRLTYLMTSGVVRLCEALVPGMVVRGNGVVVIVSSIATFTPMRKAAPYAAAKSFATAYARSLDAEVRTKGIDVVAVCPGYVRTNLHARAGLDHLAERIPTWLWLEPIDVVTATMRGLRAGRNVIVPGAVYRLARPFLQSNLAQRIWSSMARRH